MDCNNPEAQDPTLLGPGCPDSTRGFLYHSPLERRPRLLFCGPWTPTTNVHGGTVEEAFFSLRLLGRLETRIVQNEDIFYKVVV